MTQSLLCRQQLDPSCFLRRPDVCLPETTVVVQVKYTNPLRFFGIAACLNRPTSVQAGKYAFWFRNRGVVVNQLPRRDGHKHYLSYEAPQRAQVALRAVAHLMWLSLSGSDQAREGRLVNALAVRGDEGRDTLR